MEDSIMTSNESYFENVDCCEASSLQKQYYMAQKIEPRSTSYNLTNIITLEGDIDEDKLVSCINFLLKKHEILRTKFKLKDEKDLFQIIEPFKPANFLKIDSPVSDIQRNIENFVQPFDLTSSVPVRFLIVNEVSSDSVRKSYLIMDIHHILVDERSLYILMNDFISAYAGKRDYSTDGKYTNYVYAYKETLDSGKYDSHKKYWDNFFSKERSKLFFEDNAKHLQYGSSLVQRLAFHIPKEINEKITHACKMFEASPYTLFLSVYALLLMKYSDKKDIVIGSSFENRRSNKLKKTVGLFVNTLPLGLSFSKSMTVSSFVKSVRDVFFDVFSVQDYVLFDYIEQKSKFNSNFIKTIFDFHVDHSEAVECNGIKISHNFLEKKNPQFPISMEIIQNGNNFAGILEYAEDIIDESLAKRMESDFIYILEQFIEHLEMNICNIGLLNDTHREKLINSLSFWHEKKHDSFFDILKARVRSTPQRIAAQYKNVYCSYSMLDFFSSKIACFLLSHKLKREDVVVLIMARNIDFLAILIAILKVGCVYLPIDPKTNHKRIQDILKRSMASFVITDDPNFSVENEKQIPVYCFKANLLLKSKIQPTIKFPKIDKLQLAYVIHTSGSTGTPKGIMITHQGMLNHLLSKIDLLTGSTVIAQSSTQNFDVSIWQFLMPLMISGKVRILDDNEAWQPDLLFSLLSKEKISVFETVPSHMVVMLDELDYLYSKYKKLPELRLKYLIVNGEILQKELCVRWMKYYPNIVIVNAYGPAECSDDTHHYKVEKTEIEKNDRRCPIGYSIRNMVGYILNENYDVLPKTLEGDLYISGCGLARGYLFDPVTTAKKFIPNAVNNGQMDLSFSRMYVTNDRAKALDGFSLEVIGRDDRQIKIRGIRIELSEVETLLARLDFVKNVAVIAKETLHGKRIVAFCVSNHLISVSEAKKRALNFMPSFMIPDSFVFVKELPLLINGKIDYKTLSNYEFADKRKNVELDGTTGAPLSDEMHRNIANIWKEILQIEKLGINDDFFQMGGHSLNAIQLVSRLSDLYKVDLEVRDLYDNPTIDLICKVILSKEKQENYQYLPVIKQDLDNRYADFPLTDVQQAYLLGRSGVFDLGNVSVHVYQEFKCENIDIEKLEEIFNLLIQRHESLRIIFPNFNSQRILKEVPYFKVKTYDLSDLRNDELECSLLEIRKDLSHEVFDVEKWPLFDIRVAKTSDGYILYTSFDVLIADGQSMDTLFREFNSLYKNQTLPPLEVSFRDYVLALEDFKKGEKYSKDKSYWMGRMDDYPNGPNLPISNKRLQHQTFKRVSSKFPKEKWDYLKKLSAEFKCSQTCFIISTFGEILRWRTGDNNFLINLTLFNRMPVHKQINDIIGDFTSLILFEVKHIDSKSFLDNMLNNQKQLWSDLEHSAFGGVEFLRELGKKQTGSKKRMIAPVVLTSILDNYDQDIDDKSGLFSNEIYSISQTPQVWLDFKAYEEHGDLVVEWDYVQELFEEGFIEKMHADYISMLNFLSDESTNWANVKIDSLYDKSLEKIAYQKKNFDIKHPFQLIEKQAERFPNKLAVICEDRNISYKDLHNASKVLATVIQQSVRESNQCIAIIMKKDVDQVIAILAVIYANAAYVPIDPDLPKERIKSLLNSSHASMVLVENDNLISELDLEEIFSIEKIVNVTKKQEDISKQLKRNFDLNNLAYVIFTSGTTGEPKGVQISLHSMLNTIFDVNERFSVTHNDTILSLSKTSFDLSVYDIFGMLIVGGTIIIPPDNRRKDPSYWIELVEKYNVTVWNTVPMFMQMMIQFLETQVIKFENKLRLFLLSGDYIPVNLPLNIQNMCSSTARIISLGGATEASIWSIIYEISDPKEASKLKSIPYGVSMSNQLVTVLTDNGDICNNGVIGEICISGEGLSLGYLGDPDMTRKKFVNHPLLGRTYKTGDLGKYDKNGIIEIIGRKDDQLKMNGYRIDLLEIRKAVFDENMDQVEIFPYKSENKSEIVAAVVLKNDDFNTDNDIEIVRNKLQFLRSHKNVRKISSATCYDLDRSLISGSNRYRRKSYRNFASNKRIDKQTLGDMLFEMLKTQSTPENKNQINFESLSKIIQTLAPADVSNRVVGKYLYPSAGSLYPVRTYVYIPQSFHGIEEGLYYYNPYESKLIFVTSNMPKNENVEIYFTLSMKSIRPIYGTYGGNFLGTIEGGCMYSLVKSVCDELGVNTTLEVYNDNFYQEDLNKYLESDESVISKLELGQNFNKNMQNLKRPDIYVFVKEGKVLDLDKGWYSYDSNKRQFNKCPVSYDLDVSPLIYDTFCIFESSDFAIIFTNPEEEKDCISQYLFNTGNYSQILETKALDHRVGSCSIGALCSRAVTSIRKNFPGQSFLHAIFCGMITEDQLQSKMRSRIDKDIFNRETQERLQKILPDYMIPNKILVLEEIPLTANGKVDKKKLMQICSLEHKPKAFVYKNERERKIADIFAQILGMKLENINPEESFFSMGGDSLGLISLHGCLKKDLLVNVSIVLIFENATVRGIAEIMENNAHTDSQLREVLKRKHRRMTK